MVLKKAKSKVDVIFTSKDFYTNKLYSASTSLITNPSGNNTLVIDYSHYQNWPQKRQLEPEYTDYTKAVNDLFSIRKVWLKDATIVKKIGSTTIHTIKIIVSQSQSHVYPVKTTTKETSSIVTYDF